MANYLPKVVDPQRNGRLRKPSAANEEHPLIIFVVPRIKEAHDKRGPKTQLYCWNALGRAHPPSVAGKCGLSASGLGQSGPYVNGGRLYGETLHKFAQNCRYSAASPRGPREAVLNA
ncbi:MAG: hypothetical protein EOR33_28195 [Mesorhizobium sp.]|nr:MAG: hypothetical protein EOR33_28195 [Mesorhizobium sp.]